MKSSYLPLVLSFTIGVVALLGIAILTAGWDRPPPDVTQIGYRGLGMEQLTNPRTLAAKLRSQPAPEILDPAPPGGPMATDVYTNVKVLDGLTKAQFDRLKQAMTAWVAPEQGCAYCHNEDDLASEEKYTFGVSRRMLEMTRQINSGWETHVKTTGVTCYTCHRGQPVPEEIWFTNPGPKQAQGMARRLDGQNLASKNVGSTSLPFDPYTPFLLKEELLAINSAEALPSDNDLTLVDAEWTYGLMMHFSQSLGVNCTHCHDTRTFFIWDHSPPVRFQANDGIFMVREVNNEYLAPLTDQFPPERKGPLGDVAKVNCATCHLGLPKPLNGATTAKHYPSLKAAAAEKVAAAE